MIRYACLAPIAVLAGCTAAEMPLPAALADSGERVVFEGISGWQKGRYAAGAYSGNYERSLASGTLGIVKQTEGHGAFTIRGPGISSSIEGHCWVRERALDFKNIEIKPGKMAYRCDIEAEGRPIPAWFELQESRESVVENLNRNARVGEIGLAGEIVRFRSEHRFVGGKIPAADPMGYVFEQRGKPIGALQLNGKPVLTMARGIGIDQRRAVMVASVALATFWDPGTRDD